VSSFFDDHLKFNLSKIGNTCRKRYNIVGKVADTLESADPPESTYPSDPPEATNSPESTNPPESD